MSISCTHAYRLRGGEREGEGGGGEGSNCLAHCRLYHVHILYTCIYCRLRDVGGGGGGDEGGKVTVSTLQVVSCPSCCTHAYRHMDVGGGGGGGNYNLCNLTWLPVKKARSILQTEAQKNMTYRYV